MQNVILLILAVLFTTSSTLAGHPDVVLLMTDQHRHDDLGSRNGVPEIEMGSSQNGVSRNGDGPRFLT